MARSASLLELGWGGDRDRRLTACALAGGAYYENTTTERYTAGTWHHVAMCVTAGVSNKLYVDGVLVGVASLDGITALTNPNTGDILIGAFYYPDGMQHFNGLIDEVKIYNYARTPAQIAAEADSDGDGLPDGLEQQIIDYVEERDFPRQMCRCPYGRDSMRARVKQLMTQLEVLYPDVRHNIFAAMRKAAVPLDL